VLNSLIHAMMAVIPYDNIYPEKVLSWVSVRTLDTAHISVNQVTYLQKPSVQYVDSIQTPITKHYVLQENYWHVHNKKLQICANSFAMFVL
jgi:hypothetical protein